MHKGSSQLIITFLFLFIQCKNNPQAEIQSGIGSSDLETYDYRIIEPMNADSSINAIIEIPAGSLEKWEMDKSSGVIRRDSIDNLPRTINFLGYPANYGMIPKTLLSKKNGGDGDPLDIIVIGPAVDRGTILPCHLIGVLYLQDNGEQDDKLLAISNHSLMKNIRDITELKKEYPGAIEILELWFTSYKGKDKMMLEGVGNKKEASRILTLSMKQYLDAFE